MHEVNSPYGTSWENKWQIHGETRYSPTVGMVVSCILAAYKRSLRFLWELIVWMLCIGRAPIPALVNPVVHLVSVLSPSMWVDGFLEAIWRWSLKPTS